MRHLTASHVTQCHRDTGTSVTLASRSPTVATLISSTVSPAPSTYQLSSESPCHLPVSPPTNLQYILPLAPHTSSLRHLAHPRTLATVLLSLEPECRTLRQLPGDLCPLVQFDPQLTPGEGSLSPSLPLVTLTDPSATVKLPCPNTGAPHPPHVLCGNDHK